jgi:hypothetical protein
MNQLVEIVAGVMMVEHGHLQRVDRQVRPQQPGGLPADDHPRVDVDDERHIDPARVGRDVGEVGDPQRVRGGCPELALDEISRALLTVVVTGGDRERLAPRHASLLT